MAGARRAEPSLETRDVTGLSNAIGRRIGHGQAPNPQRGQQSLGQSLGSTLYSTLGSTLGPTLGRRLTERERDDRVLARDERARDRVVTADGVYELGEWEWDGERGVAQNGGGGQYLPSIGRRGPLEDAAARDVDCEDAAHASLCELGRFRRRVPDPFSADDLERDMLELTSARLRVPCTRIDADIGCDVISARGTRQHVDGDVEVLAYVRGNQFRDVGVRRAVWLVAGRHVGDPSIHDFVAGFRRHQTLVDIGQRRCGLGVGRVHEVMVGATSTARNMGRATAAARTRTALYSGNFSHLGPLMPSGPVPVSLARKFSLWYFRYPPFSPYVSLSVSVDFAISRAYLESINALDGPRVSVQHLVTGAIGRVYHDYPIANASIVGGRIERHAHVGAAMPVNLLDGPARRDETSIILVEQVERRSLRQIADSTRRSVRSEHAGKHENRLVASVAEFADRVPYPVLGLALDTLDRAARIPWIARQLHRRFPFTVAISNPGAALPMVGGAQMRGAAFSPPHRLYGVGTLVGVFPLQDEVVPHDGRPAIRSMLPILYVFDHRLFDGVMAGRILTRLFEVLQNPEKHFGADGQRGED